MQFCQLVSEGTGVVDCALMEIKDENVHHQSALDGLRPLLIAAMVEHLALPIRQNVASLHAVSVALASIMDDTLRRLEKAELALQMLAHHNDIIANATQCCLDEAELSTWWLIDHEVANASAIEMQHGRMVALELCVDKVNKEGVTTVSQLRRDVNDIKLQQLAKIYNKINIVSTAMSTLDENMRDSLDQVHLHVDAFLQHTTTPSAADLHATPQSAPALAPELTPAPAPAPVPTPVWTSDPILASDPNPALVRLHLLHRLRLHLLLKCKCGLRLLIPVTLCFPMHETTSMIALRLTLCNPLGICTRGSLCNPKGIRTSGCKLTLMQQPGGIPHDKANGCHVLMGVCQWWTSIMIWMRTKIDPLGARLSPSITGIATALHKRLNTA
jgi:hypothetical protein